MYAIRSYYVRSGLPLLLAFMTLLAALSAGAAEVPRMSSDELRSRLGEADLVVLDSRSVPDWQRAVMKIKGAVRVDPGSVVSCVITSYSIHYTKLYEGGARNGSFSRSSVYPF